MNPPEAQSRMAPIVGWNGATLLIRANGIVRVRIGFLIFIAVLSVDMETGACHRPNTSNTAVMIHRPVNLA